ncbi:uncharacterized protein DS421_13g423370 [Arachis hypogaea]|nr:uncharacterized protein DS421_13g423370 [Arachis hypogaea]
MPVEVKAMLEEQLRWKKIGKACMSKRGYCINFAKERWELCQRGRITISCIHSKVLAHPDDAIGKVCSPENGKRVRDFSNVACPRGFVKSKRIFGGAICGGSSSASQQHVADLERQLQEAKGQVATLHRFLQQKYGDEVPAFSDSVPHIESE